MGEILRIGRKNVSHSFPGGITSRRCQIFVFRDGRDRSRRFRLGDAAYIKALPKQSIDLMKRLELLIDSSNSAIVQ